MSSGSQSSLYLYDEEGESADDRYSELSRTRTESFSMNDSRTQESQRHRKWRRRATSATEVSNVSPSQQTNLTTFTRVSSSEDVESPSVVVSVSDSGDPLSDNSDLTPSTPLYSLSDQSSSFSALYESETVYWIKSVVRFLEKPILFGVVAVAGSRVVRFLSRLTSTVSLTRNLGGYPRTELDEPLMPLGYPSSWPRWLVALRSSLPPLLVERPLAHCLRSHGVPVLSEVLPEVVAPPGEGEWPMSVMALREAVGESGEVWLSSGPMVPAVLFLPLFTLIALQAARTLSLYRMARVGRGDHSQDGSDEESVSEVGGLPYREVSPPGVEGSDIPGWGSEESSPTPLDADTSPDVPHTLSAVPRPSHRSETREPEEEALASPSSYIRTPKGRALSPMELTSKLHLAASPLSTVAPKFSNRTVIAVLLGEPTRGEVNQFLIASVSYGCFKTVLPRFAESLENIPVPPSAPIEYSDSVLEAALEMASRRKISVISVFARKVVDHAIHLLDFTHPTSAIYVFCAANGPTPEDVAKVSSAVLYVHESGASTVIPINECFSQIAKQQPKMEE